MISRRSLIIAVLAVLLFITAIFSIKNDFKSKQDLEPEQEPEQEPEKEPYQSTDGAEIVDSGVSSEAVLTPEQEKEVKSRKTGKNG